jgi:hypothetical protein
MCPHSRVSQQVVNLNFIVGIMSIAEIAVTDVPLFQLWFSKHMTVASFVVLRFCDPAEHGFLWDIAPYRNMEDKICNFL